MLQDFAKHDDDDFDLKTLDKNSRSGLNIGSINDSTPLSLRESYNKIIHATEAKINWLNSIEQPTVQYWGGVYELLGKNNGSEWQVELNIPEWCASMIRFNKAIQESIDWQCKFKNDA